MMKKKFEEIIYEITNNNKRKILFLQFNFIQLMMHGIHVRRGAFVTVNINTNVTQVKE